MSSQPIRPLTTDSLLTAVGGDPVEVGEGHGQTSSAQGHRSVPEGLEPDGPDAPEASEQVVSRKTIRSLAMATQENVDRHLANSKLPIHI